MTVDFRGAHYPKSAIVFAVTFYVRYAVSYRDLEEIMAERGVDVDHATLNRWVVKYAPVLADRARQRKRQAGTSWRMDETYIRVKGSWMYLYRAGSGKSVGIPKDSAVESCCFCRRHSDEIQNQVRD